MPSGLIPESQRDVREVNGVAPSDIDRQCRKVLIILKRRRESSIPTNHGGALYFNSSGNRRNLTVSQSDVMCMRHAVRRVVAVKVAMAVLCDPLVRALHGQSRRKIGPAIGLT